MESKHHKLARSLRSGPSDHDLKPNAATRDQLNVSSSVLFLIRMFMESHPIQSKFNFTDVSECETKNQYKVEGPFLILSHTSLIFIIKASKERH